jgi:hypothetical protein
MSEHTVLTGSTGSTRANPIVTDEDGELQQKPEDSSDADTVRMSTPEYERWASDNCRTKPQNLFLAESTLALTFVKYHSGQQFDGTQIAQSSPPIAGGESNEVGDSKKGT